METFRYKACCVIVGQEFRYLGMTLTNQSALCEEIKARLNSEHGCYWLVWKVLSFSFLSEDIEIKLHRIIFLFVHNGWEMGCPKLGE